ncbi:MAG TPA: HAMP domain-containing sensor histidine kinase [Myxococcales bacterium]|nr:HAMP domain-containing sensor histidine kinase [Myxococcales bacterium]
MLTDEASRGKLLTESSTRAFAALRTRAIGSLSRIRAVALSAFCLVALGFSLAGDAESRAEIWPLLAYALSSYLLLRWRRMGGWRARLTISSPMFDVAFIFLLLWRVAPFAESQDFNAGWTVGAFALLVMLSALSLRASVISATAALAFLLLAALQLRTGISFANLAMSGVVLGLTAMVAAAVVRELSRVVARLVVNEVSHEELRRAQTEAETLTHLLVHDMKGPLTGLIGLAEVVASEVQGPLQTDVKMIEQQGRRLQAMVGDLLAIARLERGVLNSAPEPVDLSALLVSLANAYTAPARGAGALISAAVEPGLSATLHREMVHRFFDNLVLNAIDFVRPGGKIEVSARREGQELVLAVRNTGDPVPQEARARLFQKGVIERGSRQKHNLGLGLYLCRLVAVAHDGSIALREEPGWATSFVARLPVEARPAEAEAAPPVSRAGNA